MLNTLCLPGSTTQRTWAVSTGRAVTGTPELQLQIPSLFELVFASLGWSFYKAGIWIWKSKVLSSLVCCPSQFFNNLYNASLLCLGSLLQWLSFRRCQNNVKTMWRQCQGKCIWVMLWRRESTVSAPQWKCLGDKTTATVSKSKWRYLGYFFARMPFLHNCYPMCSRPRSSS